ncbi:hypothetical protein HX004_13870 [Myroides sp. 1354]|uniref:hypothetical protein n=1 Tax=unclassified Myroides TaxID=2642485 RepID=UPI0025754679|nr:MULTISPECIES: hypothetical protein [unclassified Myroides]MDM1044447.1 hypothetical protein [Myroides sp. R163-1]MDM1056851.1 hypothetical protein [Myroides sp. 1354]MDM1069878.1 hypothetical protein [Myroides sp. 1372]
MDQYVVPFVMNEKSLAISTAKLRNLLLEMQEITSKNQFRSRKKEITFYSKDLMDILSSYWFLHEIGLLYSTMPLDQSLKTAYLNQKWQYYCSFKSQYYHQYSLYCIENEVLDWQAIKYYFHTNNLQCAFTFFDATCVFLFSAYFKALQLILEQLEYAMSTSSFSFNHRPLRWNKSKIDLSLLVYALFEFNKNDDEKVLLIEWTNAFEKLFNTSISKNFHQTLSAFQKRKNIDYTIISQLRDIIQAKYMDIE